MNTDRTSDDLELDGAEEFDSVEFAFGLSRRTFVQVLGAGLLVTVSADRAAGQQRGRGARGRPPRVSARVHLGQDGTITVLSGKVEMGQGARGELAQAAAEELRVPADRVQMLLADTAQVPDDGITAGSRTTPSTVPAVRQAAAAARQLLVQLACRRWQLPTDAVEVHQGRVTHPETQHAVTYAELAAAEDVPKEFDQELPDVEVTPVDRWRVLGKSMPLPNRRDFVTGVHRFPSDFALPETLYGKVLRAPSYGAKLMAVDLEPARAMPGVVAVRDGDFVGVAAPSTFLAGQALEAIAATARWQPAPHPSSDDVFEYLRDKSAGGGVPAELAQRLDAAPQSLRQTYHVPYVQHAPLETRAALAAWEDGRVTVWTGTQNPFGYHRELAAAFHLPSDRVRVIVPDFGGGFGGKHSGEAAIEAARLARAAKLPVSLVWTREEEFTWAYFRPAAVIDVAAGLDDDGRIDAWHFVNINSGGAAVQTPYRAGQSDCRYVRSESPVRQGSYRVLAATANNFARECFMDELAGLAGADPLEFRLRHLQEPRLRAVLEEAARQFAWNERGARRSKDVGVGLACGTEKGSYVAACVEIAIDRQRKEILVRRICQAFECGAILNPNNLLAQVQGCIVMGLGPALREQIRFQDGKLRTNSFSTYRVPRFRDLPQIDVHLLNRTDLASAGAGETPIIAVAPAIANAVFDATGQRVREMPIRVAGI